MARKIDLSLILSKKNRSVPNLVRGAEANLQKAVSAAELRLS
jgi:hypothetical protein